MISRVPQVLFAFTFIVLLGGCTASKYLGEGEKYYEGAELKLESTGKIPHRKTMLSTLEGVIDPKPNEKILGSRPQVWFYHIAGDPKKDKGFRHWMKYKLGRAPVLMSQVNPDQTKSILLNRLQNAGYFDASLEYHIKERQHSGRITYQAKVKGPYGIRNLHFPPDVGPLRSEISALQAGTLIKEGNVYNLSTLLKERDRISDGLKNKGFYYFTSDYLLFEVDSTVGQRQVDIFLSVKGDIPLQAALRYSINDIKIQSQFKLSSDSLVGLPEFIEIQNQNFKSRLITNSIYFRPGSLYNAQLHQATLNRLIGLGAFKFINLRFTPGFHFNYFLRCKSGNNAVA